ncbi:ABC transporter ATP-binding protein [Plantactinospora sp. WMMC1484]|uniref:ABC transporter ATP-binding protein n=1 Tax=Plantactinospora sp. WMMC1484 TaxID=3404122 RepID=UPI003BF5D7F8
MRLRMPATTSGLWALMRLLPQVNRTKVALGAAGIAVAAVLPVAMLVTVGLLVGKVPDAAGAGLGSPAGRQIVALLVGVGILVVAQRVVLALLRALSETLGREVDRYLQERALAAVGRPAGIAHLEDPEVLAGLHTLQGLGMAQGGRPSLAVEALAVVLPAWLRALGAAAVLLAFHWWLGLLWLVTWPTVLHLMQREYLRVGRVGYGRSAVLRRAEYFRDLAITGAPAKEVRIWGMLGWLQERFATAWSGAIEPVWRERRPRPTAVFGATGAILLVNLLSYGLLVYAAARGDLGVGALAVYVQALTMANVYTAFDDQNAYLSFAADSVPRLLRLDERLGTSGRDTSPADAGGPEQAVPHDFPTRDITFHAVRFRYPGAEEEALRGVDLRIPVGRSLAVVGENGAGKTSLIKLLCGLESPTSGTISVDGRDTADLGPAAWRGRISAVFQDFTRYHLSAAENIGIGAPQLAGDRERLCRAAERAGALSIIEALPRGWDTVLSPEYDGGTELSGGQWQRIVLARALFAVDAGARVVVLDEPTSALDIRAEAELNRHLLDLTAGRTVILVSHRFSTVRGADRIVVLDHGRVVEDGTHEQLLEVQGHYARMFHLQAARFVAADSRDVSTDPPLQPAGTGREGSHAG